MRALGEAAFEDKADDQRHEMDEPLGQQPGRTCPVPICIGGVGVGRGGECVGSHGGTDDGVAFLRGLHGAVRLLAQAEEYVNNNNCGGQHAA